MQDSHSPNGRLAEPSSFGPGESRFGGREITPLRVVTAMLHHRRLIATVALVLPAIVAIVALAQPRSYTARASFIPYVKNTQSSLQGLAAQFGVDVPGADPTQSIYFYSDLLRSTDLLNGLLDSRLEVRENGATRAGTLLTLLDPPGGSEPLKRMAALDQLKRRLSTTLAERSGIITIQASMPSPELAYATIDRTVALVNEFNSARRRTQAAAERQFAERRVSEVRGEIGALNDRWLQFLKSNRAYTSNFEQSFENERFAREAEVQKTVLAMMLNTYEQAKIDEVRNTPVITVVDHPLRPARPDPRGLAVKLAIGLLVGLFLGVLLVLWKEFARIVGGGSSAGEEYLRYAAARDATLADLRLVGGTVFRFTGARRTVAS
jgi:uncharacterized protein involved in exopolysaccharide biosynthesis